ncbi:MAG: DUF3800 domain-containing protein [Patescibacteria group bacterium]
MKKQRTLFLDESGKADFGHYSKNFVLSACPIPSHKLVEYNNIAKQIIFKYWGSQKSFSRRYGVKNIVLHAKDIARCEGPFIILSDEMVNRSFWSDIYSQVISKTDITYYISLVDKIAIKKTHPTWKKSTSLSRSYSFILDSFIRHLKARKITAESSHDQDLTLINVFNTFQRNSYNMYRSKYLVSKLLTSISLVNKNNDGIGSQIADLMAWTGANKHLIDQGYKNIKDLNSSEKKLLNMFNRRLKSKAARDKYNKFKVIKK